MSRSQRLSHAHRHCFDYHLKDCFPRPAILSSKAVTKHLFQSIYNRMLHGKQVTSQKSVFLVPSAQGYQSLLNELQIWAQQADSKVDHVNHHFRCHVVRRCGVVVFFDIVIEDGTSLWLKLQESVEVETESSLR